jgi:iron complex outermembrane receptor protein
MGFMRNSVFGVGFWLAAGVAAADPPPVAPVKLDIQAQPMADALNQWAQKTGYQVIFPEESRTAGLMSSEVKGRYAPDDALAKLLANSGLRYEYVNDRTISVRFAEAASEPSKPNASKEGSERPLVLARAQSESPRETEASNRNQSDSSAAAGTGGSDAPLEEIVVTAQKRLERLIDVPISIAAIGSDELTKRRVVNIDDLQAAVPGMSIVGSGELQRRIMLRGVGNTFGGGSLIGMYLDEVPATPSGPASELDLRTYDLERVEVLRGPQGTLYGAASAGGTIRFITAKPDLDSFGAKTDLAASFTEDGDMSRRIEGMVNVPLIESELGLRVAGTYDRQGGWMDQPALGKEDINDRTTAHVRAKALWKPSSQLSVDAMAVIHRTDGSAGSKGEDANGNFAQAFNLPTTPSIDDDYDIYNLTMAYDFNSVRLLSATSFVETSKDARDIASFAQLFAPPAPRRQFIYFLNSAEARILTEEVRLTSQGDGRWQWTVGGFYRRAKDEGVLIFSTNGVARSYQLNTSLSKATSFFADASFQLTQKMKVGVGARYFEEDRESQSGSAAGAPPAALGPLLKGKFDSVDPRVYLQYKWNEDVSTYASAAKGFRSGGFNAGTQPPYDPEKVWTYELGSKLSVNGGRLGVEAAVFYSNYSDYQVSGVVPTPPTGDLLNRLSNAGDARIRGVEASLRWRPVEAWAFGLNGTWLDTEFTSIAAGRAPFNVGDNLDLIPKYAFSLSAEREWTMGARPGFVRLDYSQQARVTYRNRNLLGPAFGPTPWYFGESDIINQLGLNIGLQWSESLSLNVFADNLLNDRGHTSPFAVTDDIATRARPRTFGVQFGVDFD